jgi:hypothetical protein
MGQVTGSNVSSHFPISDPIGANHTPPSVAGNPKVTYAVPPPAVITVNGQAIPKIDVRQHAIRNVVEFVNNTPNTGGVVASIDRFGQLLLVGPGPIVIGGDSGVRAALGV